MGLIYTAEDIPLDPERVDELTEQIKKEAEENSSHGQINAVTLADIPGLEKMPVIDGFHRFEALRRLGKKTIYATIKPLRSWEEVWNRRIENTPHRSVRFARLNDWVNRAWGLSKWSDRIRVAQAFSLVANKGMTGERLGLSSAEIEEIREWVTVNSRDWRKSPGTIYQQLHSAEKASPALVRKVREHKGGIIGAITQQQFQAIVGSLEDKFGLQHVAAEAAVDLNLNAEQTRALAVSIRDAQSIDEAKRIIKSGSWKNSPAPGGEVFDAKKHRKGEVALEVKNFTAHIDALVTGGHARSRDHAEDIVGRACLFMQKGRRFETDKGQILHDKDEPIDGITIVKRGAVLVGEYDLLGNRWISEIADPITIIGTEFFHGEKQHTASVEAITDCISYRVSLSTLRHEMVTNPTFATFFLIDRTLVLQRQHDRLAALQLRDVAQKLASVMLELIKRGGDIPFDRITQGILGEMAAATRESVNKTLSAFKREGVLAWDKGPLLADEEALQQIYDGELKIPLYEDE